MTDQQCSQTKTGVDPKSQVRKGLSRSKGQWRIPLEGLKVGGRGVGVWGANIRSEGKFLNYVTKMVGITMTFLIHLNKYYITEKFG